MATMTTKNFARPPSRSGAGPEAARNAVGGHAAAGAAGDSVVVIGYIGIEPMVAGDYFKGVIIVDPAHPAWRPWLEHFHGAAMGIALTTTLPFSWRWQVLPVLVLHTKRPDIPAAIQRRFQRHHTLFETKYYFDKFNELVLRRRCPLLGKGLWRGGDVAIIDGSSSMVRQSWLDGLLP